MSCLIYVICVCLCIVVSNTYCVVFLLCFSSSCVPYATIFYGLSCFDCPFSILMEGQNEQTNDDLISKLIKFFLCFMD
jgi:hypothetical protein